LGMRHSRAGTAVAQALRLRSATLRFFALDTAISFTSHPPYDAGDLRRGYRRLVPCRLFWLWTGRRAGLLVKPPPVPLSALELLSSTITSNAPGFAKPHQCRCMSEILCVVARSATLAVSRLFRDLVTTSATTVSRDVTSCCATVSSCCCPATWGPTWLWPLQLRQQAVYACTVYKDPRYAKPHSSVLTTHCSVSLSGLVLSFAPP
jgi:hypothetical protein